MGSGLGPGAGGSKVWLVGPAHCLFLLNKVLLKHCHSPLLTCFPRTALKLQWPSWVIAIVSWPAKLKIYPICLLTEKSGQCLQGRSDLVPCLFSHEFICHYLLLCCFPAASEWFERRDCRTSFASSMPNTAPHSCGTLGHTC